MEATDVRRVGQLVIAALVLSDSCAAWRLGIAGAIVFLLAISPLGVGSAFPFGLIYGAALVVMERNLELRCRVRS